MKKLCLILLSTLLAACSSSDNLVTDSFRALDSKYSDVADLTAQLRSPQAQPVTLNQLVLHRPLQKLLVDDNNRIDITVASPIVHFSEGNSFVAALLLPDRISQFTFALESIAGRTIFMPTVLFLDDNFQEVARIDKFQLNDKNRLLMEKKISAEMASKITSIMVYSKDNELDGKTELIDIAREYEIAKGKIVSDVQFPKRYAKHSPVGNLNIRLKNPFFSGATVAVNTAPVEVKSTITSESEATYLQDISDAVKGDDISRALHLVEEAEKAGSTKAQAHFMKVLKNQQK